MTLMVSFCDNSCRLTCGRCCQFRVCVFVSPGQSRILGVMNAVSLCDGDGDGECHGRYHRRSLKGIGQVSTMLDLCKFFCYSWTFYHDTGYSCCCCCCCCCCYSRSSGLETDSVTSLSGPPSRTLPMSPSHSR